MSGVRDSFCFKADESVERERWEGGSLGGDGEGFEGMKRDKKLERDEEAMGGLVWPDG